MFKNIRHVHFVGIGGSGMSGIAEVLIKLGYRVTGSDLQISPVVKRLVSLGAIVSKGHQSQNVNGAHVVVTSTAVSPKNPEVLRAHKEGIPVIPRVEMLAELARLKYTIAIAGTHGKTTTSSLVAQILTECQMDPTVIVGGRLKAVGTGGVLGKGDYLVAEADESDGSFLKLAPTISVITNIDNDHLDYYKTPKNIDAAFTTFANRLPFYGTVILCGDDPRIKQLIPKLHRRCETYGFGKNCDLRAQSVSSTEIATTFQVIRKGKRLGNITLSLAGRHNVLNALAAVAVGLQVDLTFNQIARALELFEGVGRRMEFKGNADGVVVLDDYGHHPTEIEATLSAIRERFPKRRFHVVFQPHRYSRTKALAKEFGKSLAKADKVFLMPIYPAGEKPIKGVSSVLITKSMKKKNWVSWSRTDSLSMIMNGLKEGDVLLTLGAGDVWKVAEALVVRSSTLATRLAEAVPSLAVRIKTEEPLSRHCTWGIGGPAEVFVEVHNLNEFRAIVNTCQEQKVPMFILGWGSNLLLPDEGLRGCVVRLRGEFESIEFDGTRVKAGAGVQLPKLAQACAKANLTGIESLAGVPGTVGGALMTNAGTSRGAIGDVVSHVAILDRQGRVVVLPRTKIDLRYRSSNLGGCWVVSALLKLKKSDNGEIWQAMREELDYRQRTQPLGTKNVGSVFRNPPNHKAAHLLETVGLKGRSIGGLRFSHKHANFIENVGGGTSHDALALIQLAQRLVRKEFHVDLEPEIKIVSASPNDSV